MIKLFHFFSSLRLTITLLGFAMLLIFLGTLEQVHYGIYETQQRYFATFLAHWTYPPNWPAYAALHWFKIPLPGGFLLGLLLLINLIFAHFKYFVPSWKKTGIVLLHTGILLLIVSGFSSSLTQVESHLWLHSGKKINYSESTHEDELVLIKTTPGTNSTVYSIPIKYIHKPHHSFEVTGLPFTLETIEFYKNADLALHSQNPNLPKGLATRGAAEKMGLMALPKPPTYTQDTRNATTAYIHIKAPDQDLGIWLLSTIIDDRFPPQQFEYQGNTYQIALRFKRYYYPFSLELLEFNHDRYPGTEIPYNFSSLLNIHEANNLPPRKNLIYMNHPLRLRNLSFYQASFTPDNQASMLQVVYNPLRTLPYIAVLIVGLGLALHFIIRLGSWLGRKS